MTKTAPSEVPAHALRPLGRTGLLATTLGFGGYRVGVDDPEHRASLEQALQKGCNLIDTSTNYADGDSETCIGQTLKDLFQTGDFKRDHVILVTKVGYVQGKNLEQAKSRQAIGKPFEDMVKYHADCWHCVHPDFIADQLSRSLARLELSKVDVLLLHNPEYFFSDAVQKGQASDLVKLRRLFTIASAGRFYTWKVRSKKGASTGTGYPQIRLLNPLTIPNRLRSPPFGKLPAKSARKNMAIPTNTTLPFCKCPRIFLKAGRS